VDLVLHEQIVNRLVAANLVSYRSQLDVIELVSHDVLWVGLEETKDLSVYASTFAANKGAICNQNMCRVTSFADDAILVEWVLKSL